MMAQPNLHGAWSRRWVTVGNGAAFETQSVIWLQAGPCYADLRVPFHPDAVPRCFAGRSGWDGEEYRWTHELDLEGAYSPAADDTGEMRVEGGAVIERGLFPTATGPLPYEEMWVGLPGGEGVWQAFSAPHACLVRVGGHSITVVDLRGWGKGFAAAYWVLTANRWVSQLSLGDPTRLPTPDTLPPADWRLVGAGDSRNESHQPELEHIWTP
jgi:hypothetical protein